MSGLPWRVYSVLNKIIFRPRVLIVELNPYHGELLPGYTYLFQKMGYEVELLIRAEVSSEMPFSIWKGRPPKLMSGSLNYIKDVLDSPGIATYDLIFFSTNVLWEAGVNHSSVIRYLGKVPVGKRGSIFVEHNLTHLQEDDGELFLRQGRLVTLLNYELDSIRTRMVNPHFFGSLDLPKKSEHPSKILVLGSSSREPRNLEALFTSLRQICKEPNRKYEVSFVGGEVYIPEDLRLFVTSLGRLNFPAYYKVVQSHDFLLTLIDPDDELHARYSQGTTTGTVQISLGFNKPMILDSLHAKLYGFDDSNSVVYPVSGLIDGLRQAIEMDSRSYRDLTRDLGKKSREITNESLENLSVTIQSAKKLMTKDGSSSNDLALYTDISQAATVNPVGSPDKVPRDKFKEILTIIAPAATKRRALLRVVAKPLRALLHK